MEDHNQPYLPSVAKTELKHLSFADAKPGALQAWLDALPKVQLGETAGQLYMALNEIAHLQVRPQQRIQFIAQVLEPMQSLQDSIIRKYLLAYTIDQNSVRRASLMLHRLNQYAIAAIWDNLEFSSKPKDEERLALACIFERLHHDLLVYQLCHKHPHPGLWQCFNHLLAKGQENHWFGLKLPLRQHPGTFDHCASAILLQACCQPNQCVKVELVNIFEQLDEWRQLVIWHHPKAPGQSQLIARPGTNLAPLSKRQAKAMWTDQQVGVDTKALCNLLKNNIDTPSQLHPGVSNYLLAHLIQCWSGRPPRGQDRLPVDHDVLMTWGMKNIHTRLGDKSLDKLFENHHQSPSINNFSSRDVWESIYHVELPSPDKPIASSIKSDHCQASMVNISPKGCGLTLDELPKGVEVGELIAIRQPAREWHLGIIRWQDLGKKYNLGIELLAPHARACAIKLQNKSANYSRAVLTNLRSKDNQIETLIAPRLPFKTGDKIILNLNGHESLFILEARLAGSSRISLFKVQPLEKKPNANNNAAKAENFWKLE